MLDRLEGEKQVAPDHIVFVGRRQLRLQRDGEREYETVLPLPYRRHVMFRKLPSAACSPATPALVPNLEDIVRWPRLEIRDCLERYGLLIPESESTRTDRLALRPSNEVAALKPTIGEQRRRAGGPSRDHDGEVPSHL